MTVRRLRFMRIPALLTVLITTACTNSPTQPSGAATASVTIPRPLQPNNNSQISISNQPLTLTVQNAVVTKTGSTTYTFEVASDAAFANKVQTKDGVSENSSGQTSVTLDPLATTRDYYWHARVTAGGTTGLFGPTYKFTLGAAIVLSAPAPIGPLTGSQTSVRPALRVTNTIRQGPAGSITYKFDIARDAAFSALVVTGTVAEGINETGFIPNNDLPTATILFWRATAIDAANSIVSSSSAVQSFTAMLSQAESVAAQLAIVLWPGTQPPGTVGHATMGDNWQVQTLHHLPTNTFFQSPTPEMLRLFDLLDRGFDPDGAIGWMNGNGYFTTAQWYPPPDKAVIGLQFVYLAARNKVVVNGTWELVLKAE
jgi:hypothetical protein